MSVHLSDRAVLARLIRLCSTIINAPHAAADHLPDLIEVEADLAVATRCPASPSFIGYAELVVITCLMALATKRLDGADAYRCTYTVQLFVEKIGENYLAADRASRGAR
jgi:hypothetical protein